MRDSTYNGCNGIHKCIPISFPFATVVIYEFSVNVMTVKKSWSSNCVGRQWFIMYCMLEIHVKLKSMRNIISEMFNGEPHFLHRRFCTTPIFPILHPFT